MNQYLAAMGIEIWQRRSPAPQLALDRGDQSCDARTPAQGELPGWEELKRQVCSCTNCELHVTRTHTVFGTGNERADWMFVGEAPGREEDRQGLPFVGRAGQLLTAMIAALGMKREDVYIANVLKCRPPNNRDPMGQEVTQCEPYLHRQVAFVEPQIIVALGRFAAQSLLKTTRPIGKLRGERFTYENTGIPLVVTYHPAYLLRNPVDKKKAWQDLCLAKEVLASS